MQGFSVWALWILAASLGVRHAMAPDHLAAVTTFVKANSAGPRRSVGYALRIGLGHAVGMAAIAGALFWGVNVLAPSMVNGLARLSGVWLIVLAVWMIGDVTFPAIGRNRRQREGTRQARGGSVSRTVRLMGHPGAAWGMGLVLGLIVSPADLAIFSIMLSQSAAGNSLGLLGVFLGAMLGVLAGVGMVFGWSAKRKTGLGWQVWISGVSGVFGLGVGLALVAGVLR